ncbi:hypothetical protein ACJ5NV_03140 [Loktanella agnita]|uniref:hypothetical protein n=1 Tax=Loktanella agnita TaxID=287097 RepID=UPI0039889299
MKTGLTIVGVVAIAAIALFGFYMVDIDQTQEARLPDVDVSVEGGQAPEFDADVGTVNMGQTDVEVEVPEVDVRTTTETVSVPTLSVEPPAEDDPSDES